MNSEIQQRIEMIQKGEVPEGYQMTKIGIIPKDWDTIFVGDIVEINTGSKDTQDKVKDGKYPFFVRSQTMEKINSYSFDGEAILTAGDGVGVGKVIHYINGKFDYHLGASLKDIGKKWYTINEINVCQESLIVEHGFSKMESESLEIIRRLE